MSQAEVLPPWLLSASTLSDRQRETLLAVAQTLCNAYETRVITPATSEALATLLPSACFLSLQLLVGDDVLVSVDNLLEAGEATITFLHRHNSLAGAACLAGAPLSSRTDSPAMQLQDLQHIAACSTADRVSCVPLFWHWLRDEHAQVPRECGPSAEGREEDRAEEGEEGQQVEAGAVSCSGMPCRPQYAGRLAAEAAANSICDAKALADVSEAFRQRAAFPCLGALTLGCCSAQCQGQNQQTNKWTQDPGGEEEQEERRPLQQLSTLIQLAAAAAAPVLYRAQGFLEEVAGLIGLRGLERDFEYVPGEGFVQLTDEDFMMDEDDGYDMCDGSTDEPQLRGGGSRRRGLQGAGCGSNRWPDRDPDKDAGAQAQRLCGSDEDNCSCSRADGGADTAPGPEPGAACSSSAAAAAAASAASAASGLAAGSVCPMISTNASARPMSADGPVCPMMSANASVRPMSADGSSRPTPRAESDGGSVKSMSGSGRSGGPVAVASDRSRSASDGAIDSEGPLRQHPLLLYFLGPDAEAWYLQRNAAMSIQCDRVLLVLYAMSAATMQHASLHATSLAAASRSVGDPKLCLQALLRTVLLLTLLAVPVVMPRVWMQNREAFFSLLILTTLPGQAGTLGQASAQQQQQSFAALFTSTFEAFGFALCAVSAMLLTKVLRLSKGGFLHRIVPLLLVVPVASVSMLRFPACLFLTQIRLLVLLPIVTPLMASMLLVWASGEGSISLAGGKAGVADPLMLAGWLAVSYVLERRCRSIAAAQHLLLAEHRRNAGAVPTAVAPPAEARR